MSAAHAVAAAGGPAILDAYELSLAAARPGTCRLRLEDGSVQQLPVDRWLGPPSAADRRLLAHAIPMVLDVGCGPGRHLEALGERGMPAVGIDISRRAVALARSRGAKAVRASVFGLLPAGRYGSVLLLDGNIGIGGDPVRLLKTVSPLLRAGGVAIVELGEPCSPSGSLRARIEGAGVQSPWFTWAQLNVDRCPGTAARAGFSAVEVWNDDGRWFARLAKRRPPGAP